MELSVIIDSFNVRDFLKRCLLSVKKASENIDCEIFVVDNKSGDGSSFMVEQEFPEVILIKNQVNSGYSAAAFMLIRREAFSKTGLLDEEFFMYG